ncbi:hypothetical protein PHYBOEH_001515 [Phytophthora boehmeriae]|uniref:Uncharacterized protein n=1 Tax=Phytophthora boehmeriae TaxID=109152 RepID=A0A8T1WXK8_9STRA|nr:hypothetical protein PHYBOEH_001515 [Phytophthora boehmeriae]
MATHQAHRLPWNALADVFTSVETENGRDRYVGTEALAKKVLHFCRCLVDALKEFKATDKRPAVDDETGESLDPTTWGIDPTGSMGYTGYYDSLLRGYVELNLLLLDPHKFVPFLQRGTEHSTHAIGLLCGHMDGGHPEWMAARLQPIMREDDAFKMKPLGGEEVQRIRDHAALLFRCLYSISGDNRALDASYVASGIAPFYIGDFETDQ